MVKVTLGNTGITVEKNAFGALPIQRISTQEAVKLLRKAYDKGVTFFDTARFYTDSEEKLGEAFEGMREKVYIATKTGATDAEGFWKDIHTSLKNLRTGYIDIYQFHNPAFCPKPGDGSGLYEAMLEAKEKGIWGVQREKELDEFLSYIENPPAMNEELAAVIAKDREELLGDFCRGCGYCMPCPVGIEINNCARMSLLIRRSPSAAQLTPQAQEKMKKIESCLHCGRCKSKCPYGLDTPVLLEKNYKDYCEILAGKAY